MPIEINPFWKLINPVYALSLGIALISCVTLITYLPARNWPKVRRTQYTRLLALVSEILVSVGIIGLLTFTARAYIETKIRDDAKQVEEYQRLTRVAALNLLKRHCPLGKVPIPPTPEMENIYVGCELSMQLLEGSADFMTLWAARDRLMHMTTVASADKETIAGINALKSAVNNVIESQTVADRNVHRRKLVESDVSWVLIFLCAVLAILGIGLKWTRAFLDFRKLPGE